MIIRSLLSEHAMTPSTVPCSPGRWGTQLKSGKGEGKSFICQEPMGQGFREKFSKKMVAGPRTNSNKKIICVGRQSLEEELPLGLSGTRLKQRALQLQAAARAHGMCCNLGRNEQTGTARVLSSNCALLAASRNIRQ